MAGAMEEGRDEVANAVPDPNQVSHRQLIDLMKADAARQEPLVAVIATMLEETITRNELNQKKSTLPAFQGRRPPLTASAFVTRLVVLPGRPSTPAHCGPPWAFVRKHE
jgi:hypothetical protein